MTEGAVEEDRDKATNGGRRRKGGLDVEEQRAKPGRRRQERLGHPLSNRPPLGPQKFHLYIGIIQ